MPLSRGECMEFIADLHIHSHHSVATSKNLVPEHLEYWSRIKGIHLLGTGDCIHPGWLAELKEKLEPADGGLFRLKKDYRLRESRELSHESIPPDVRFILTGELSTIFKRNGRVRKVHSVCVFPDFDSLMSVQRRLDRIGNIRSDGRPILGLDVKDLFSMVLESGEKSFLVPAHIWTPWFSVLGSKSGFDSIEECFEDLTPELFAVETGLSSDPPMNRTCSFLDRFSLVSNSDAHSPEKLGREATVFTCRMSYDDLYGALKGGGGLAGTIEFFPEEGKYHYDGHRKCGVRWNPVETARNGGVCPECGREVTRGVMHRVAELADKTGNCGEYRSITPLPDIIAEMLGQKSASSKKAVAMYHRLIRRIGSEFHILLKADLKDLAAEADVRFAEGIRRLRCGEVELLEGYDGEFGKIRVFGAAGAPDDNGASLFQENSCVRGPAPAGIRTLRLDVSEFRKLLIRSEKKGDIARPGESTAASVKTPDVFTADQQRAVEHGRGPCFVIAGPGSGKTAVLTGRVEHLIRSMGANPSSILALAFSNKAAGELRLRLGRGEGSRVTAVTMHQFGLSMLAERHLYFGRSAGFFIAGEEDRTLLLETITGTGPESAKAGAIVSAVKNGIDPGTDTVDLMDRYDARLRSADAFDLDDLIALPVMLLEGDAAAAAEYRSRYPWILVDEAQDMNPMQYRLVRALAGPSSPGLFVIGDPDQSIYGFRGAGARFMYDLAAIYPEAVTVSLGQSFRCPDIMLRSAKQVLGTDSDFTGVPSDLRIQIISTESDLSEADWIATEVEKSMGGVRSFSMDSGISDGDADRKDAAFSDFAVLCRSSFQFEPLVRAMENHGIPHTVVENRPFYLKEPYLGPLNIMKECVNRHSAPGKPDCPVCAMKRSGEPAETILGSLMSREGVPELQAWKLAALAAPFGAEYRDFMRSLELRHGADDMEFASSTVAIMTIHAAKGLEFDTVFIPACEDGIIPFTLFGHVDLSVMKEEERLLYVAMTRSRRRLYLLHAASRTYRGRRMRSPRSPFLDRIGKDLFSLMEREPGTKDRDGQLTLF